MGLGLGLGLGSGFGFGFGLGVGFGFVLDAHRDGVRGNAAAQQRHRE